MSNGDRVSAMRADSETIPPPESFIEQANVTDESIYEEWDANWPECWERAASFLDWMTEYDTVLDADGPSFRWFSGGQLNASYNCVDRHLSERSTQDALHWEGVGGETRTYTYLDLYHAVNECAAALRSLGVEEDDVVTLYLPMIPELPIAMLACARIGAPHNIVFADFSADVLASRIERTDSAYLITADGYYRSADAVDLKSTADNARITVDREMTVVVVDRLGSEPHLGQGYYSYDDLLAEHAGREVEPVVRDASSPLFRIYTSGTTGEPKAVEHTTGGYLAHIAWTSHAVLDIKPEDTYWCAADISWITGHSYVVYGPLALGTTSVMYEGLPERSGRDRVWDVIERNEVDILYTSPTTVRTFMKRGSERPAQYDLSSLRLLGTVGEPIDPRTWMWYYTHVGNENCPVVDTWWQTETGAVLLSTLPGIDPMTPGTVGRALPGIDAYVVDATGTATETDETGYLTVAKPWPGMPSSLATHQGWATNHVDCGTGWQDSSENSGAGWQYISEDSAVVNADEKTTILGRVDDVITIAGHRLGTTEIERAICEVEGVAETAVVTGEIEEIHAYVSPERRHHDSTLRERVGTAIETVVGSVEIPTEIIVTPSLPKTRSGKIMRRLLKSMANDEEIGDISALRNPELVGALQSATSND
jgi:acetyl-CoA synthetase